MGNLKLLFGIILGSLFTFVVVFGNGSDLYQPYESPVLASANLVIPPIPEEPTFARR